MNEPVAYLMVERNDGNSYIQMSVPTRDEKISHHPYPLYTYRELTDEEIVGIRMTTKGDIKAFARAVIREAQEK